MSGTRNTLGDLNNILFEQMERLNDIDLTKESSEDEVFRDEVVRAKAISDVADKVINTASLVLEGQKLISNSMNADAKLPRMLESK